MRQAGLLRGIALALGVLLISATAAADIKSFNAAMLKRDYKAAAVAAASAWPDLDKSRDDLAVIAREFSFAAYLAGEFDAARIYGEAAAHASRAAAEEPVDQIGSELMWRLAEHRISPSGQTRSLIFALLEKRAAFPSMDLMTYLSADAVTAYDFDKGLWRDAVVSAALGDRLTAGRPGYLETNFRFVLVGAAANYMAERDMAAYGAFGSLLKRLASEIAAAPASKDLTELEEVYRETSAWRISAYSHLKAMRRLRDERKHNAEWGAYADTPEFRTAMARITPQLPEGACVVRISDASPDPRYPSSALFKGMIGTIILKMDIDAGGQAHNARLVAAVPAKHFADVALKNAAKLTFQPVEGSAAGCTLAQNGKVITYQFMMPN